MKLLDFILKKEKIENSGYSFLDWRDFVESVINSEFNDAPFDKIRNMFPEDYSEDYNPMLANLMEKLENGQLKNMFRSFNKAWGLGIQNNDITLVKRAWQELRVSFNDCLFFREIDNFPKEIGNQVEKQVIRSADDIQMTCKKYIRQAEDESGSSFMKDIYYLICKDKLIV